MKTLILSDNYPPERNANARIFSELAECLQRHHVDVSVITSHPNFPTGKIFSGHKNHWRKKTLESGVQVIRVKTFMHPNKGKIRRTFDFLSFGFSSFLFGLFEKQNDCIIGVTPQFFCAVSACLLSIVKRKPFILVLCDLWPDAIASNDLISKGLMFKLIKKIEFFMYREASTIAILSPNFRGYLNQAKIDNNKIIDFISGASEQFYPRENDQALVDRYGLHNKIVLGYVGTFGISHNHEDIIETFKILKRDDLHLFMIGDGAKKNKLVALINKYQLKNITIAGPVDADQVARYWSVCDAAIVPLAPIETNKTVIPSKVLESMSMGLPALLYTPTGEVTRFFSDSKAIWHVEASDMNRLQTFLEAVTKEKLEEKKENALAFSKKFSRENQAKILLKNLQKICDKERTYETV